MKVKNVIIFRKTAIFQNYSTMRLQNNCIETKDPDTIRVNPLTGEKRLSFDNAFSNDMLPQLSEFSSVLGQPI